MSSESPDKSEQEDTSGIAGKVRKFGPLLVIALGFLIGFIFFRDYLSLESLRRNREALIAWRDAHYLLSVLGFMALYIVVVAFSLPGGAAMTLAGGFLFGLFPGVIYVVVAATIGASLIFLAAKTSLGDSLRKRAGPWMKKLEDGFKRDEVSFLFLLRLVPVVPFFVANLAPAFFGVALFTYVWTTFLGIIPGSAVYTWVGAGLGELFNRGEELSFSIFSNPNIYGPILALCALAALPMIVKRMRGKPVSEETQ